MAANNLLKSLVAFVSELRNYANKIEEYNKNL